MAGRGVDASEFLEHDLWWTEDQGQNWNLELGLSLSHLHFNPFATNMLVGILDGRSSSFDSLFELWVKE